ncbi:group B streptococcal surface immunogenic protein [Streptococcus pneumoniae]|nr:group B streptococcal surface immunogenic protein [Streptococcus pneumoniae]
MRQTNVRGSLSLRGFRKLRTGAIVATGVILLGLGFLAPTVSASEQDGVWVARTVEEVKADLQKEGDLFKYVIKWGDTLSVISEASNIPVDVLQEMNQASGKNLFLPHNELYFTEAETVSDTVTKHKIVIKESGASGEVRTYEVLLKKDQETKAVTFELTDVTEKVEKMAVNYSPVYQPVSAPVVERAEESGEEPASETSAETSPEVKEETEAPVAPKAEKPVSPAPKAEEPVTPAPKAEEPTAPAPKAEEAATTPAPKVEAPTTPTPKEDATEGKVEVPKVEEPEASAEPKGTAPVVEEGTSGEQGQPVEETPAPSKPETPASTEEVAKEAEATEPEVAKPAESNAEAATEASGTSAETTPKENETEGTTPGATAEAGETTGEEGKEPEKTSETANTPSTGVTASANSDESGNTTEEKAEMPKVEEPAPAVEGTTAGEQGQPVEENPAPKETGEEGKAEDSVSSTESSSTASEGESTVTQPSVESGTDSTSEAEGKTSEESGTQAPAESATASKETDSTSEKEVEESGATGKEAKETEEKLAPKEDSTSGDEGNAETSNNPTTGATTSADSDESTPSTLTSDETKPEEVANESEGKESAEAGTSATTETATPAPAVDSTNEAPNEGESENPVAEGTPVTEEQPSTDNTVSSSATSNSADSSLSTESTAPESTTATTGNTSNSSTDVTTDGNSNDSTSNEEKPQADEPAIEHKDSEKSLEKETEDSNKAAIDDDRKTKDEEINKSTLNEDKKKEALEKVKQLTEEYHKKLATEQDTEKQVDIVEEYREELAKIETPGVTYDSPDYNKPIESHAGGTTIDENSTVANSALTSSNPSSQPSSSEDSPQTQPAATSDSSTTGDSGFRSAGTYQPRVTRRRRSIEEPQNTVSIYYNFDGMKDIPGFFGDPGEKNTVTIPAGTSEAQAKELVKEKIQAKVQELNKRGYTVKEEIVFEQDTTVKNFNYVVTFTKQTTGTTGFRVAPKVQVRAKKVAKRDLSNKTKQINIYYNLTNLKDIAGALGEVGENNLLTLPGNATKEDIKKAVAEKTKAQIEKLKKQGFTVTSTTNLDQIIEGRDSYDYVVEFTKEAKTQPVGTTGFRNAPLVQRRAKRSTEAKETVNVNIYFNLKALPGIAGALDVDGETTIKLPKNASEEEVKEAIKAKIAKVENRGYRVNDFYFGAKTEKGYDYVVEFTK